MKEGEKARKRKTQEIPFVEGKKKYYRALLGTQSTLLKSQVKSTFITFYSLFNKRKENQLLNLGERETAMNVLGVHEKRKFLTLISQRHTSFYVI